MQPTATTVVALLRMMVITMADMTTVTAAFIATVSTTMATMMALMVIKRLTAMQMAVVMMPLNTATPTRATICTNTINTTAAMTIVMITRVLTYCFDSNLLRHKCFADFGYTPANSAGLCLMHNSSGDLTADYG